MLDSIGLNGNMEVMKKGIKQGEEFMNYYIADLHLRHNNIIAFNRAKNIFANIEEMNQAIISNWNRKVKSMDTVYILGDFSFGDEKEWIEDLKLLNGKKVLIQGNHDLDKYKPKIKLFFTEITNYLEVTETVRGQKYKVVLSHYPMLSFNKDYKENTIHLFGHVHQYTDEAKIVREYIKMLRKRKKSPEFANEYVNLGNMINVGACCPWMRYTPQTLEYLLDIMKKNQDLLGTR